MTTKTKILVGFFVLVYGFGLYRAVRRFAGGPTIVTVTEVQFCEQAPPEEFTDNCILFKERMVREIERAHVAVDKWQEILDGCVSKALCCYRSANEYEERRERCKQFLSGDGGHMRKQCVEFVDGPEGR